ncbi:MAG: hypothetical protein M3P45_09765 [Acidobacteriota bacterium]|nr:hypothetical protein [Acidobacteriota bacterium]
MKKCQFLLLGILLFVPLRLMPQSVKQELKTPAPEALVAARKACTDVFSNLAAGKSEDIAAWITNEIGYTRDAASKISLKNDFKSKLDLVLASPPVTPYGKLSGYDLIEETYLPHSNRYFRLTYISYHEGAPLIWEFRFYVKPDGKVALSYIVWSEKNPFEYISSPEYDLTASKK